MRNSFNIFLLTSHITVHFFVSVKVKQCDIVTLSVNVCSIFIPAFVHTRSEALYQLNPFFIYSILSKLRQCYASAAGFFEGHIYINIFAPR
jgi:hypothetical protein